MRLLRYVRDLHGRIGAAFIGLARLVLTHSHEEGKFSGNASGRTRTDSGGKAISSQSESLRGNSRLVGTRGWDARLQELPNRLAFYSFRLQWFPSETMRHSLSPDRACDAPDRINDAMYHPRDAHLGPGYDVLTSAIQQENNEYNRERAHKQDREHDQGTDLIMVGSLRLGAEVFVVRRGH